MWLGTFLKEYGHSSTGTSQNTIVACLYLLYPAHAIASHWPVGLFPMAWSLLLLASTQYGATAKLGLVREADSIEVPVPT